MSYRQFQNLMKLNNYTGMMIIKPPPLRIFGRRIFPQVFIIPKNPGNFFSGSYYSKKKSACGELLLLYFSQKAKFGLSGGRFFNKIRVFALKYQKKISPAAGWQIPVFIILKIFPPAAGSYYSRFFKIRFFSRFLLFSQNQPKILFCSYYSAFEGVLIINTPVIIIYPLVNLRL